MVLRYKEQIGQAIRGRRLELGMTQKQLAEATHIDESQTVSRWERGLNLPSDLEAVAEALGWTIAELMSDVQPPARMARQLDIAPAPEPILSDLMDTVRDLEEQVRLLRAETAARDAEVLRRLEA